MARKFTQATGSSSHFAVETSVACSIFGASAALIAFIGALWPGPASAAEPAGGFNFDQRVACSTQIKDLDWSHTLWPQENPEPKPTRPSVLSDGVIRAQVENRLRMESALLALYNVRLDASALQTEMNRIALSTRAPDRLREVHAALGNDAVLVAECLARPELAERRLREGYANDARWHGDLRARAEAWLAERAPSATLAASGGREARVVYRLRNESSKAKPDNHAKPAESSEIELSAEEFQRERDRLLPTDIGSTGMPRLLRGETDALHETALGFVQETVLSATAERIVVRSRFWEKLSFDAWWQAHSRDVPIAAPERLEKQLTLPVVMGRAMDLSKNAADSWREEGVLLPEERAYHVAIWTGSEMLVWGGQSTLGALRDGWRYNPLSDSWTAISASNAPSERYQATAIWTGTEMLVWGGTCCGGNQLGDGGRYNPAGDSWTAIGASGAPSRRDGHTAVWTGSEMLIWGGCAAVSLGCPTSTGGRYNPVNDSWTAMSTNPPGARARHTAIWTGSEMLVWGGMNLVLKGDGWRYDPVGNSWTAITTSGAPSPRASHTAIWTGSEMLVWGGAGSAAGGRYNPVGDSWTAINTSGAPSNRGGHTAIWTGGEMLVWGGSSNSGTALGDGGRYNPAGNSWTSVSVSGAPRARSGHTAIWTGSEMLVWGGEQIAGSPKLGDGGRYNPVANGWTIIAGQSEPPSARSQHTAVWTGNEMLVWGGFAGSVRLGDGGRYNLVRDSWTTTSAIGAPSPRALHSAIWTGSEMLVWGGDGDTGNLGAGARYNPLDNCWTAISTSGAPSARAYHTAVWTGSEMLAWGGYGNGVPLGDGGRYSPATNSWAAISTSGAPSGRYQHTAIWTGSEMLVWGGVDNSERLSGGGRYSPPGNSWTAISASGVPSARYRHTAIWTGNEMLVWGGCASGECPTSTGGRYNPLGNSWMAVITSGAPSARYDHTAVWTGSEMLVWGGAGNSGSLGDGARYNPMGDGWTAISASGAPSARHDHSAVWTGNEMIVWAGCCTLNSMGVYYPYASNAVFANGFE